MFLLAFQSAMFALRCRARDDSQAQFLTKKGSWPAAHSTHKQTLFLMGGCTDQGEVQSTHGLMHIVTMGQFKAHNMALCTECAHKMFRCCKMRRHDPKWTS